MEGKERKLLLIVDPQLDFITGTLPVPGAAEAMDALAGYVDERGDDYMVKMVTSDWHPYRHCSFEHRGGPWPAHCVQHSPGAAVWPALLDALNRSRGGFTMLYKGDRVDRDEYSVMQNDASSVALSKVIAALRIDRIDVCGLAGNVCVLNTAQDLVELCGADMVRVLTAYAPSLDDGSSLRSWMAQQHVAEA